MCRLWHFYSNSNRLGRGRDCRRLPSAFVLLEESILNFCKFHRHRTFRVLIHYAVDPRALGKAPHLPGIKSFQQIGRRGRIRHSGIKPKFVAIWIEDDGHRSWTAVVTAFDAVARIEQVFIHLPLGSFHRPTVRRMRTMLLRCPQSKTAAWVSPLASTRKSRPQQSGTCGILS
jgi:hypothetical protein